MENPLVSIITINFDHPEITCALLESLRKVTYPDIEIIVVDNASPNDDPSVIPDTYPEIIFIQSKTNLGFAGGNNLGIRQAKGKYILLLNNDTEVEPGFLEPLVTKLENNAGIGAVSPKIKFYSQPETIQFAGQAPINPYTMRSYGYAWGKKDDGSFDCDTPTFFVHGAALMIPAKVIENTGLMAEIYFLYYEELDWGTRIRQAGYELWYVHNSTVLHKESMSTGKLSPFKTYYMNRSRLLYLRRNVKSPVYLISILYQIGVAIPKNLLTFALKADKQHFKSYLNALGWHLKNLSNKGIHANPTI